MSIQITVDGKTKEFGNKLDAMLYLENVETQGFPISDYRSMIKALKKPIWKIIK